MPNVSGDVLKRVLEYCQHAIDFPKPIVDDSSLEDIAFRKKKKEYDEWEKKFFDAKDIDKIHLINAANYLNIKMLLDAAILHFAIYIKELGPEKMAKQFNIEGTMTAEEEEKMRKENPWMELDEPEPAPEKTEKEKGQVIEMETDAKN